MSAPSRPLRVLQVTEVASAGVGRHFLDLSQGLLARGCDVHAVYSPTRLDALVTSRLAAAAPLPLHTLAMRRSIHPLDARSAWQLVALARRLGPFDLIHGHSSKGGALARLAAWRLGIPAVYTPNAFVTLDPTLASWKRAAYGRIERFLARGRQAIIAVSHEEAAHARRLGIAAGKIHVVCNGIAPPQLPTRQAARERLGLDEQTPAIGFVGRLSGQKAPQHMLAAFARVRQRHPQARLVIVGDGPLGDALRQQAEREGTASGILWLGDVIAQEVMPAFDLFCLSSLYEGLPYVLLEALAARLPLVVTQVGGVRMVVEDGVNGRIVPPGDPAALAAALDDLLSDEPLRRRMAQAAAEQSSRLTLDRMVAETLQVYETLLAS